MPTNPLEGCVPGVLSGEQIRELVRENLIKGLDLETHPDALDHSSFDLTLSDEGYHLPCGSVKPFRDYDALLDLLKQEGCIQLQPDASGSFRLKARETYVFRVQQELGNALKDLNIHGQATAKSSVGRVDVLARLIVDGMDSYESFDPERFNSAPRMYWRMYLEITPLTFDVRIRSGCALSQLRLFYGKPESCEIHGSDLYRSVFAGGAAGDGFLRVDLSDIEVGSQSGCALRADGTKTPVPIALWRTDKDLPPVPRPDPTQHWDLLQSKKLGEKNCLKIDKNFFYIMRSQEKIALPAGIAVYCRAIDETIGEMRIHYAGFVHPLFGRERKDRKIGTPLIFEVRGHDVKVLLTHGEKLARLTFYRMSKDAPIKEQDSKPDEKPKNPYGDQTLKLSSFFAEEWTGKFVNNA